MAQSVIEALHEPKARTLIIINGLSGIGKSTILNNLSVVLHQSHATVVEPIDIQYPESLKKNGKQHLVTTATLGDFDRTASDLGDIAVKTFPGISVHVLDLPGMNEREILDYITRLQRINALPSEQIAQYSMGIPLLADRIASQGINRHTASFLAAKYLKESFRRIVKQDELVSAARPFLRMSIPDDVQVCFSKIRGSEQKFIYEYLFTIMEKQRELLDQRGIVEDSPLFLAPESEEMYDTMLRNGNNNSPAWIDIFVPELPVTTLAKLQQAFGFQEGTYFYDYPTRVEMFLAMARKVSIWHKDEQGHEAIYEGEYEKIGRMAHALMEAFQNKEFPITPQRERIDGVSFYVHAHDHSSMVENPVQIGWLTESLLQQNGVSYIVLNKTYGTNYTYDSAQGHIVTIPSTINLDKYIDRNLYRM